MRLAELVECPIQVIATLCGHAPFEVRPDGKELTSAYDDYAGKDCFSCVAPRPTTIILLCKKQGCNDECSCSDGLLRIKVPTKQFAAALSSASAQRHA